MPDVRFAVVGPLAWDNTEAVRQTLQKLGGKYGVGRLVMITTDGAGLAKVAREEATRAGIQSVMVVPTLHGVYGRRADVLAWHVALELEPQFLVVFHWDIRDRSNREARDAWLLARRAGVRVVKVKVSSRVGMMAADEWYKLQERKESKRRKKKR